MADPPTIRQAVPDDLTAINSLTEAAYAPYVIPLGAPPLPMTEDYAPRIEAGEVWLLEHGGGLGGLIVLERHPTHATIFSVAVDPSQHGKGFGSLLLQFAETTSRHWGVRELRLYTNAKMERNIAIYRAKGYHETGRRPHPERPGFTIVDMVKPL